VKARPLNDKSSGVGADGQSDAAIAVGAGDRIDYVLKHGRGGRKIKEATPIDSALDE